MLNVTPVAVAGVLGAADGYLARGDAVNPTRQGSTMKMYSTYLEFGAVLVGAMLNSRARSEKQTQTAEAFIYGGAFGLGRRAGVYGAAQRDKTGVPGGASLAAGHVFRAMTAAAPEFVPNGNQLSQTRQLNAFV